jgi:hypothetical protein
MLGPSTKDISANDLMWEFFERHARKAAGATPDVERPAKPTGR